MTDRQELVALADCPIGLFLSKGELCLKTEYGNNEGRIDAYIVSSGEFFWGGASAFAEQRKVLVQPLDMDFVDEALRTPRPAADREEVARITDKVSEIRLLIDEYNPKNSDWYFRKTVICEIIDVILSLRATTASGECCVPTEGEPHFVLLGRDPQAPALVEQWASDRARYEPGSDKPAKAEQIATNMRAFKASNPELGMPTPRMGGPSVTTTAGAVAEPDGLCACSWGCVEAANCRRKAAPSAVAEPVGEYFVDGDKYHVVFRPGGGLCSTFDQVYCSCATGEGALKRADKICNLLNGAHPAPSDGAIREALEESLHWHERADKALSKSGRTDADYYFRRREHQDEIERISATLSPQPATEKEG